MIEQIKGELVSVQGKQAISKLIDNAPNFMASKIKLELPSKSISELT